MAGWESYPLTRYDRKKKYTINMNTMCQKKKRLIDYFPRKCTRDGVIIVEHLIWSPGQANHSLKPRQPGDMEDETHSVSWRFIAKIGAAHRDLWIMFLKNQMRACKKGENQTEAPTSVQSSSITGKPVILLSTRISKAVLKAEEVIYWSAAELIT